MTPDSGVLVPPQVLGSDSRLASLGGAGACFCLEIYVTLREICLKVLSPSQTHAVGNFNKNSQSHRDHDDVSPGKLLHEWKFKSGRTQAGF